MEIVYMENQSGQVRWFKATVGDEQQRAVWKHENGCWRSPKENTVGRTVAAAGAASPWMCGRAAAARSRVCAYCWNHTAVLWWVHKLLDIR